MAENLGDKVVCVIDYGSFIYVAQKLCGTYGTVFYHNPSWKTSFPKWNGQMVGVGVDGIEVIDSIWPYFDDIDLFVFTDLFQGEFQQWLVDQGKLVFGSGIGSVMETDRADFKELMKENKMPVNKYEVIHGLDNLKEYLTDKEDKYIKTTGNYRGEMETFHFQSMRLSKSVFDMYNHTLGLAKYSQEFIVEDPIQDAEEIGSDIVVVDGKYPSKGMWGIEIKDAGYLGIISEYDNFPSYIKYVNHKLSNAFASYGYRGPYSNEIRVTKKGIAYLTDMTCRFPEPPTSLYLEMYDNYGEIVWDVASGIVPDIKNKFRYGAEIIIKSEHAKTEPQEIYFPEAIKKYVKIKNLAVVNGIRYFVPQNVEMAEIGAVIGMGNTLEEAISQAKDNAKQVEGFELHINCEAMDDAQEQIDKMPAYGIKFK